MESELSQVNSLLWSFSLKIIFQLNAVFLVSTWVYSMLLVIYVLLFRVNVNRIFFWYFQSITMWNSYYVTECILMIPEYDFLSEKIFFRIWCDWLKNIGIFSDFHVFKLMEKKIDKYSEDTKDPNDLWLKNKRVNSLHFCNFPFFITKIFIINQTFGKLQIDWPRNVS